MKFEINKEPAKKNESTKSWLEKDIKIFPQVISDREKEVIYRQLAVLQASGVDFRSSFQLLIDQVKKKPTQDKLNSVLLEIIKGKSLSSAMRNFKDFTPYEIFTIKIGEETGKLNEVLFKLSAYFENRLAQRRQMVSSFSYPVLILSTSIGAVSFMMFFIIPMFQEVFKRFNGDLPALTKTVIATADFLKNGFPYFLTVLLGLITVLYMARNNRKLQYYQEKLWLNIPLIGGIYKDLYLARFTDSMGLLIQSNVPMIHTLEMVSQMIGLQHIQRVLDGVRIDLVQGKTITEAFGKYPIFDKQMMALIKVGEEVNRLGEFFEKLSGDYTNSVKHRTSLLATFMEPFMIIFLGLVVGVILIAMYLPMFELSSGMNFGN